MSAGERGTGRELSGSSSHGDDAATNRRWPTPREWVGLVVGAPLFALVYIIGLPFKLMFAGANYLDEVFPLVGKRGDHE